MVNSMVERATSGMLIGPDWAVNIEICDVLNNDPGQVKDVIKGVKKRLGSKNPKVQLLTLTLLETIIKNCGHIVHMHVAEKDILQDMVKIVKKKADFNVKEKILILIDTWQEAFGGPRARYPRYYAAYQELLGAGAVFPQRSETSAPVLTPPQTQPLTAYPQNLRSPDYQKEAAGSSAEPEFLTLSLTEIQSARGIMDVLAEMLNAVDPGKKEGLNQEVIVDLVEQCQTYKQRVVHLVNSTSDESLLSQGLALNDELQRVLAKHEAIASGTSAETEKTRPQSARALLDVQSPLVDTGDKSRLPDTKSTSNAGAVSEKQNHLLLPAPCATNGSGPPSTIDIKFDLLSGDDYISPNMDTSLALVPSGEQKPTTPTSQQNSLVPFNIFSDSNVTTNFVSPHSANLVGQTHPLGSRVKQHENLQSPQGAIYANGDLSNPRPSEHEQSLYVQGPNPAWNGQVAQQQQLQPPPSSLVYGGQSSEFLPPPPWEAQPVTDSYRAGSTQYPYPVQGAQVIVTPVQSSAQGPQLIGNHQLGMYIQRQHIMGNREVIPSNQLGLQQQPIQGGAYTNMFSQPTQTNLMTSVYPQQMYANQYAGYGYSYLQPQGGQYLEQQMYGLSVKDDSSLGNSFYQISTSSYAPSTKPTKPEDKLFGDLVDIAKFKSAKQTPAGAGSM